LLDDSLRAYFVILSHTWGEGQAFFQEIQGPHDIIENKPRYIKVKGCSAKAILNGFEYVQINACCMDKRNSAELSEAVNLMFKWCRHAVKCYAHLQTYYYDSKRNGLLCPDEWRGARK